MYRLQRLGRRAVALLAFLLLVFAAAPPVSASVERTAAVLVGAARSAGSLASSVGKAPAVQATARKARHAPRAAHVMPARSLAGIAAAAPERSPSASAPPARDGRRLYLSNCRLLR
jgi:hypothetical protein